MRSTIQRKRLVLALAILVMALGALGVGGWQLVAARRASRALAGASQRLVREQERLNRLEDQLRATRAEVAARQDARAASQKETPAESKAPAPTPLAARSFDVPAFLREHPELREIYETSEKESEMFSYGWLITMLTPVQTERFKGEQLRHDLRGRDISAIARAQGWARDNPELVALRQEERGLHERELAALLGDEHYGEFQRHDKTLLARETAATDLAQRLYYTDTPLTPDQAERLTESVARHGAYAKGRFDVTTIDWQSVLAEARAILLPQQFERLENVTELRRLYTRAREIEAEFNARLGGPR